MNACRRALTTGGFAFVRLLNGLALVILAVFINGCAKGLQTPTPLIAGAAYVEREALATSLFPSDQVVLGDEAVGRILSSRVELPAKAKVAVMKFPESNGRFYWQNREDARLQESQIGALAQALQASEHVGETTALPTLMVPTRVSIPVLREAAVRMQADLLLVYRIGNDTYSQDRFFSKDKVKAYSTCELVLLDIRTGLVPFTRVVSREVIETKQNADFDLSETMRRAEQASATAALKAAAEDLVRFVRSVPEKRTF